MIQEILSLLKIVFYQKKINLDIKSNTKYKLGITQDFNIFPCSSEISDMINNTSKLVNHLGHEVDNQFPEMTNTEEAFKYLELISFITLMVSF